MEVQIIGSNVNTAHSKQIYQCEKCNFTTHWKVVFDNHNRAVHKELGVLREWGAILRGYSCENCEFTTNSVFVRLKHVCDDKETANLIKDDPNNEITSVYTSRRTLTRRMPNRRIGTWQSDMEVQKILIGSNVNNAHFKRNTNDLC
ncbi:hypothetical protein BDFB_009633, partial [Asbolus verrucosus]